MSLPFALQLLCFLFFLLFTEAHQYPRWEMHIPIRRKRYSHKETQTYSHPPSTVKEHFSKKGSMNSSELWYSTIRHDGNHEASVINTNNEIEYTFVNVPKQKENIAGTGEQSEYDYVLIT